MRWQDLLESCSGFQWDEGNASKNWIRHRVTDFECEQVFFNRPLVVRDDEGHSGLEQRFFALGRTDADRGLFLAFTVRGALIRIISARDMTVREWRVYGDANQKQEEDPCL
jgi:uncharacterized DUF497 family protein